MSKILELTAQQESLIAVYREKWMKTAFSTQPIDQQEVSLGVGTIYKQLLNSQEFEIFFFDSPLALDNLTFLTYIQPNVDLCNPKKLNNIIRKVKKQLLAKPFLDNKFFREIVCPLIEQVGGQLDIELWRNLQDKFYFPPPLNPIISGLRDSFKTFPVWQAAKPSQKTRLEGLWRYLATGLVRSDCHLHLCSLFDFCISELQCCIDKHLWHILTAFVTECGWTFLFQDFCFLCNRPCHILLDDRNRLHAEHQPAIRFSDGFSIFVQHGESDNVQYFA